MRRLGSRYGRRGKRTGLRIKTPVQPRLPGGASFPTSRTHRCCVREVGKCAGAAEQDEEFEVSLMQP